MDDLIRRQAAIDAHCELCDMNDKCICIYCKDIDMFESLPTAEPRKGKWEIDVDCEYDVFNIAGERTWAVKAKCSECGFTMRCIEGHGVVKYCPNCGARMEAFNG